MRFTGKFFLVTAATAAVSLCSCDRNSEKAARAEAETEAAQTRSSLFAAPAPERVQTKPSRRPPPEAFRQLFELHPNLDTLYVPIKGESFLSLQQALAEKGYGNVTASDFKPVFVYEQAKTPQKEITATVVYTAEDAIPANTTFFTMPLRQFVQAVMDDSQSQGAVFDPGVAGATHAFDTYQLSILNLYLKSLPESAATQPLSIERRKEGGSTEIATEEK
jgi:hypothetical protein